VTGQLHERAFAKVNLVLQVGQPRGDGLHPMCSLMASLDLADQLTISEARGAEDVVHCPGVPDETLCRRAAEALRGAVPGLPPLDVSIEKRIPVAAGLGGGSADAAAVLRAGNELAGSPLSMHELRKLAAGIGSDVPSQLEPGAALVGGVGERVAPVELARLAMVIVPQREGLSTPDVYAELDRIGSYRAQLAPEELRHIAAAPLDELAGAVENDLQAAALSLRPELQHVLERLRAAGALAAGISGSGPTAFGLFRSPEDAERAAYELDGALAVRTR
jgi:4-diphosphocytidyl-2-C-methyl-D-erythritol kinase